MGKQITVLGAGSVGIGCAKHLLQRGWQVTMVDRREPARETSFGNAGVINASSFIPLNNTRLWRSLPAYLRNNKPHLRYRLRHVLTQFPWMFHFLRHATPAATEVTVAALSQLSNAALDEHKAFMQRAGNMHRLIERGWLKLFRQGNGLDPASIEAEWFRDAGISISTLDANAIRELEPVLAPIFNAGFLINDSSTVNNPGELLREYAAQFVADGGVLLQADVTAVRDAEGGGFILNTSTGEHRCEHLVVAAGPWSGDVLAGLGYRVRLGWERGYHQHFKLDGELPLTRTIHDVENAVIMSPMEAGVRITSGVELNHRDAPDNRSQLEQVIPLAREILPLGEPTPDPVWRGSRPTLPDSRPIIDRAPRHERLWLAFGHQHIGLMTGPVSGKLLAQLATGEQPDIDLTPFNARRWVR